MATLQLISNPSRRKRRKSRKARKAKRAFRRNPAAAPRISKRRRRRSRRSSPKRTFRRRSRGGFSFGRGAGILGAVKSTIKPAGIAAAGAVALDIVWAYLPLPDTLRAGPVRHVAKFAGAIALGMVAEKVLGKETGKLVTMGAATVVLAGVVREAVGMFAPQLRLAGLADEYPELAYINPAAVESDGPGMSEYQLNEYQENSFDSATL
jgi:hypothetical protein